jgi:tol-pal system protein YbgF
MTRRPMRTLLIAGTAIALQLAPYQASAQLFGGDDEARRAIIEMRGKLESLTMSMEERTAALAERLDRLEQTARGQFELQSQIEQLRQEVAKLRGQTEVIANELSQSQRQQKDLFTDLDSRLKPFEPMKVEIDGRMVAVDQEEKKIFDAALDKFRQGEFSNAIAGFQQLRIRWPESAYTPQALFWVGSAQFASRDYKASISTQRTLVAKFPDNPRVPDALLSIGIAQVDLGDKKTAKKTFESIVNAHKGSQAAQIARERLAAMK